MGKVKFCLEHRYTVKKLQTEKVFAEKLSNCLSRQFNSKPKRTKEMKIKYKLLTKHYLFIDNQKHVHMISYSHSTSKIICWSCNVGALWSSIPATLFLLLSFLIIESEFPFRRSDGWADGIGTLLNVALRASLNFSPVEKLKMH